MIRPTNSVTIDLSALAHNLGEVKRLARGSRIMGVVKSDAYGHGMGPTALALQQEGVDCLGVAHLDEALELRRLGIVAPVVVLCGIGTREEAREVVFHDLTAVLFDAEAAKQLDRESQQRGAVASVFVKVDTGMGRLGVPHGDAGAFLRKLMGFKHLVFQGLLSHLGSADEAERDFTDQQITNFERAVQQGRSLGLALPLNNLANSAGLMGYEKARFDMVRPGIMLYGGLPSPGYKGPVSLRPVMHFKGRILQVRDLPAQTPISYGRTYCTRGPCRIAVLSAGYGDGLPRRMSNKGEVLIKGERAPILGTICMNLTVCDVTAVAGAAPGDEAVFLGAQGRDTITGDDMAAWADTISYEVFCAIGQRNIKDYVP